jgi:PAS domain S-box-containing protein
MALSAAGGRRSGGEERDPAGVSEKERHARRILQNTPDFILEFDPQGTIRFINRVFPFHEREDVIGTNAEDWLPPGDLEHFRQALQAALATGRPQECTLSIPGMSEGGAPRLVHARLNRVQKDGERRVIVVSRMVDRGDRVSPPFE